MCTISLFYGIMVHQAVDHVALKNSPLHAVDGLQVQAVTLHKRHVVPLQLAKLVAVRIIWYYQSENR